MVRRVAYWTIGGTLVLVPLWPIVSVYLAEIGLWTGMPPLLMLYTIPMIVTVAWVWSDDPILGVFGAYCILRALPYPPMAFERTLPIILFLAVVAMVRALPNADRLRIPLLFAGVFTAGYAIGAALVKYMHVQSIFTGGGIGNTNFVGAFLALTGMLAPTALLPLFALGLAASYSAMAGIAFGVGLLVRFRASMWAWIGSVSAVAAVLFWRGINLDSWVHRYVAALWGFQAWQDAPTLGHGPGYWMKSGLILSDSHGQTWFAQAHNDWLELTVELGAVALALVLWWCWDHRDSFLVPYFGPAMVAVLINAFGMMPFQIPAVALAAAVCVGCATRGTQWQPR